MPDPDPDSVLVLLSGGQDSTTCLAWAADKWPNAHLHAITAYYAQRHEREIGAAAEIAEMYRCRTHTVVDLSGALSRSSSALTRQDVELTAEGGLTDVEAPRGLPTSFVPGRNLVFLAVAAAQAAAVGAKVIVTGVCQTDYSGYPDCRDEFVRAMEAVINLAMPTELKYIRIATPLMALSKADTVGMMRSISMREGLANWKAARAWRALAHSITCYNGMRPGCGECPACLLRARGFHDAGLADPAASL